MFKNYLTIALRNLSKNKVYAFINIAGLSIGLACSMLIILYVKDEVSYDRFHSNVKNIYRIVKQYNDVQGHKTGMDGNTGYLQGPRFTKNVGGIQSFVRVQSGGADIKHGTEVSYQELLYADSNFFSVFSFPLKYGDKLSCLTDPHSVVLSEDAAKKQFGTADAVGKMMMLKKGENFEPYIVSAVAKKTPQNSSIQFEMLLPLIVPEKEEQNSENWFNTMLNTFVVLNPNAKVPVIETGMQKFYTADSRDAAKIIAEKYGPMQSKEQYHLQPYASMHLSTELPAQNGLGNASNPMYSYILSGIALFILLIACINFVNLTIARSVKRAKEIGIRKVVGGQRKQLILQFLGESFLLCFIAFFFAVVLVKFLLPLFNDLSNKALALSYLFDAKLVAGYVSLFAITAFLAGFYPALVLSGYNPVKTLYSRFSLGGKNYLQKSLVVLQFTLASFLIIATFTMYSQFNYLTHEKLGYDDSHLIKVDKQTLTRDEAKLFRSKLKENPNIVSITAKNSGYWGSGAKVNGDSSINFAYETVDEDYLPSLKIALKEGRNFSRDYTSDSSQSVIVNESFVKMAGWKKLWVRKLISGMTIIKNIA
ncbi:MAG: ABC transporter permease [Segetibacter sp.]